MATLAELQQQLDNLRSVRAGGERRVRVRGPNTEREVEFRTDAELAAAIADLERRIGAASGAGARTIRFHTSKGL